MNQLACTKMLFLRIKHSFFPYFLALPVLFTQQTNAQHNFLGKTEAQITGYFSTDTLYRIKIDTIDTKTRLLTFRPASQYPFYTYEINSANGECISYGMVSKNQEILKTYLSILDFLGEKIESDPNKENYTYRVLANNGVYCYYYIKQPYINSKTEMKRKIFYILVSPED